MPKTIKIAKCRNFLFFILLFFAGVFFSPANASAQPWINSISTGWGQYLYIQGEPRIYRIFIGGINFEGVAGATSSDNNVFEVIPNSLYKISPTDVSVLVKAKAEGLAQIQLTGSGLSNPVDIAVRDEFATRGLWALLKRILAYLWEFPKFLYNLLRSWTDWLSVWLIKTIATLITQLCAMLAGAVYKFFNFLLQEFIKDESNKWTITRGAGISRVFLASWTIVRDYANMVIVLSLISAAAMMMLRLWADKAKQLLPWIITIALLVNFSVTLVGVMIDATNIVIREFISGGGQQVHLLYTINDAQQTLTNRLERQAIDLPKALLYFGVSSIFWAMYIFFALTLFYFSFIVIKRYLALGILFILSPLAFAFKIFPFEQTNKLWSMWWENFLKYLFVLVPAAFFLRLSVEILGSPSLDWKVTDYGHLPRFVLQMIVVMGFLFAGLKLSGAAAGPFAKAILNMASGYAGIAAAGAAKLGWKGFKGVSKAAGGAAAYSVGLDRVADKTKNLYYGAKDWATNRIESVGLMRKGTTRNNQTARNEAKMRPHLEQFKNMTAEELRDVATSTGKVFGKIGAYHYSDDQRAAAAKLLADRGKFNIVPENKRKAVMDNAVMRGGKVSEFAKSDASLNVHNEERRAELMTLHKQKDREDEFESVKARVRQKIGEGNADYERRVNDMAYKERIDNMLMNEAYATQTDNTGKMNNEVMASQLADEMDMDDEGNLIKDLTSEQIQMFERLVANKKEGFLKKQLIKKHGKEKGLRMFAKYAVAADTKYGANISGDIGSRDHRAKGYLAEYDEKGAILDAKKEVVRENNKIKKITMTEEEIEEEAKKIPTINYHRQLANKNASRKAAEGMSADKIGDINDDDVTEDWAQYASTDKIKAYFGSRKATESGKKAAMRGLVKGGREKELNEFSGEAIASGLEATPKYTKEAMDRAEADFRAVRSTIVGPVADATKKKMIDQEHEARLKKVIDNLDEDKLAEVMENAEDNLQVALSKIIVKDVSQNISKMPIKQIIEKISSIPKPLVANAISSLNPTLQATLKAGLSVNLAKIPATKTLTPTDRNILQAEQDKDAKTNPMKFMRGRPPIPEAGTTISLTKEQRRKAFIDQQTPQVQQIMEYIKNLEEGPEKDTLRELLNKITKIP